MGRTPLTAARLRRALRRSPRYLAWRAGESIRWRTRRPWSALYPRLLTDRRLLSLMHAGDVDALWARLARQPFFLAADSREATAAEFAAAYGDAADIIERAEAALRHEFDLLGSGPVCLGPSIPWSTDFKTGRQWPLDYSPDIEYNELDRPTDVKVPWELSRCQHFTSLGQAYWLTGDERYAAEFAAQVADWSAANPFSRGVNWACAMDVALRAVSWIWGFHFFAHSPSCRDRAFRANFLRQLFLHGEFIVKHLEKADLNGNHYLCDGVGLVFLGCFFGESRPASRWLALGRAIVQDEIAAQTTADGVDFEMSTAYHRLVLEAFLTSYVLLDRHGLRPPEPCWTRLARMCEFVAAYTKPNGQAPLIGDADDGRVQVLGGQPINDHRYLLSSAAVLFASGDFKTAAGQCWPETFWLLGRDAPSRFARIPPRGEPLVSASFPEGGFFVLRSRHAHLVVDCGPVGFGGRGGHGHNDVLGFELFLDGINLITDCGSYLYTASREWRNRFRSTAFHNTVQVGDEELNRFLGPDALWQLRYDAVPAHGAVERGPHGDVFRGSHSGYERLADPVRHVRTFAVDRTNPRVLVSDRLDGRSTPPLTWRFHLDPAVSAHADGYDVRLSRDSVEVWLLPVESAPQLTLSLEGGWVSPSYGVKVPTTTVVWKGVMPLPAGMSFLFAERRLRRDERAEVAASLIDGLVVSGS
jgi:hypothetical protein